MTMLVHAALPDGVVRTQSSAGPLTAWLGGRPQATTVAATPWYLTHPVERKISEREVAPPDAYGH
jgi:hypothetical protein